MSKIKSVIKNKWFWVIILIIILTVFLFIWVKLNDTNREHKIDTYELWISNNETFGFMMKFKEEYDICKSFFKTITCSDKTINIVEFKIIDEKLEETMSENIENLSIADALTTVLNNAYEEEDYDIQIISNYQFDDSFIEEINNVFLDKEINIEFSYGILDYTFEEEPSTYYTVTFDTDGASSIDSVVVKSGELVEEPDSPVKEGYTFKGWKLKDQEYNFSTPVTGEITLTATWEKNKTTNNSTNKEENTTNNNTTSTINLNNNISITEYHISSGNIDCFYYMFVTNLKEVFPSADITKTGDNPAEVDFWPNSDRTDYEVSTEEINEYLSRGTLKINTSQENNFKNTLNKYKNGTYKGVANVSYTEENHRFTFTYDYISFNGLNISHYGETANKEIEKILANATKFKGTCGGFNNYQNKTLDEELCSKYNLDCDRW